MKISDEELRQHIELGNRIKQSRKKHKTSLDVFILLLLPALKELQQLREERRWRPIESLKDFEDHKTFQVFSQKWAERCLGIDDDVYFKSGNKIFSNEEQLEYDIDEFITKCVFSHFRPLPMDLPEGE